MTILTTTSTSASLGWYPADPHTWNGLITQYIIAYRLTEVFGGSFDTTSSPVLQVTHPSSGQQLNNNADPTTVELPLKMETVTVYKLEEFSLYNVWIYAETVAGQSLSSTKKTVSTLSDGKMIAFF